MATTLNFKGKIDLPEWRPLAPAINVAGAGKPIAYDLRNDISQDPFMYLWDTTTTLEMYHTPNDEWMTPAAFTAVGGAIAAGSVAVFVPSQGPAGTLTGTPTATVLPLSTLPLSAVVGLNSLSNRGDGQGYKIRVIGNASGSSGMVSEAFITANTAGASPTVTVSPALGFTPILGDRYEILSGSVYLLGSGTTAAGFFKRYDVATDTLSGNLNVTNLAATIGVETTVEMLDEQYVPSTLNPGQGFLTGTGSNSALIATAISATTLTGQATGGDAVVFANEFRNYQIRVTQDTTNKTAVGQRRKIVSHTAGASPVYTVATWTVTPSATAQYVIELANDLMAWTNSAVVTYSYAAGGFASDANWSTAAISGGATQWANPPAAPGAGTMAEGAWSITPDAANNARQSWVWWFRGAATSTVYQLDTAAGANGVWSAAIAVGNPQGTTFTTGSCSAHDGATNAGRYLYIQVNGTQRFCRFDMFAGVFEPWCYLRFLQGTAHVTQRLGVMTFIDGTTKVSELFCLGVAAAPAWKVLLQR